MRVAVACSQTAAAASLDVGTDVSMAKALARRILGAGLLVPVGLGLLFALNVLLARLLGPSEFGKFNSIFFFASVLSVVACAGFPMGAMRFIAEYDAEQKWSELKGVLLFSLAAVLALSLLAATATFLCGKIPQLSRFSELLTLGALLIPPLAFWLWRRFCALGFHQTFIALAPRELLVPLLVAFGTVALGSTSARDVVFIYAFSMIVAEVFGGWLLMRMIPAAALESSAGWKVTVWTKVSLPMGLTSIMQLGLNRWDVLILTVAASSFDVGIYSAAIRVSMLGSLTLRIVDTVIAPMIAARSRSDGRELGELFRVGTIFSAVGGLPVCLAMLLVPTPILSIFGIEFGQGATVLQILAIGQLVNSLTGPVGWALSMTGHERLQAKVILVSTGINFAACLLAIPLWGAIGAAVVTSATTAVLNVWLWLAAKRALVRQYRPLCFAQE